MIHNITTLLRLATEYYKRKIGAYLFIQFISFIQNIKKKTLKPHKYNIEI
jgi:hypothetical protein